MEGQRQVPNTNSKACRLEHTRVTMEETMSSPGDIVVSASTRSSPRDCEQSVESSISEFGKNEPIYENIAGLSNAMNYMHLLASPACRANNTMAIAFIGTESWNKPKRPVIHDSDDMATWQWISRHPISWDKTYPEKIIMRIEARGLRFTSNDHRQVHSSSSGWRLASSSGVEVGESPMLIGNLPCACFCQLITICPADNVPLVDNTFQFSVSYTLARSKYDIGEIHGEISPA